MRMKRQMYLSVALITALTQIAQSAPRKEIEAIVEREYPSLEKIYMGVHQAPELSLMEEKTGAFLAGELRKEGYEVTEHVGGYGVGAVFENGGGKTVMIRTELDGPRVEEGTQGQYANPGMYEEP